MRKNIPFSILSLKTFSARPINIVICEHTLWFYIIAISIYMCVVNHIDRTGHSHTRYLYMCVT